ncbi:MAG: DNA gyrase inhibitor YacG [Hyphomicrobiales bacterium]
MAANDDKPKAGEKITALKCPICRRVTEEKFRPFCSQRCADVDLSRWLTGVYAVPAAPDDEADGGAFGAERPAGV